MTLLDLAPTWTPAWARTWVQQAQQQVQQHARRNAMIALTECTRRRAEREEVERFLADRRAAQSVRPTPREHSVSLHA